MKATNLLQTPSAPKAPKAPKTPKAPKAPVVETPKAPVVETPKATDAVTLTGPQVSAVQAVEVAAKAFEGSKRSAAIAIHEAQRCGVPAAYGVSLAVWVVRHLTGIGLPKATAYYLADIGQGYATLGTERADLFPMEGLRTIVATAKRRNKGDDKGAAAAIREMANTAQEGDLKAAPSLKGCRKASSDEAPADPAERIEASVSRLAKWAISEAGGDDLLAAIDLLKRAAVRVDAMEKARQKAEASKA